MLLVANKSNIKKYIKDILGNEYTETKEKELIEICTKDSYTNYLEPGTHESFTIEIYMNKIDKVLNTYGVESGYPEIPSLEYCNTGEMYNTTILHYKGKLYIGNVGSIMEKQG